MVGVNKVGDPAYHVAGRETVAFVAAGCVFDIQHTGQRDAVVGPATAVFEEVVGLVGARAAVRVSKVVATADEACFGGAVVVVGEARVDVSSSLSGLYRMLERLSQSFSREHQP